MLLRPLRDYVVVSKDAAETKTPGGILIPDTAASRTDAVEMGSVVSVGPGRVGDDGEVIPLDIKSGQRVVFKKWSGAEMRSGGASVFIMTAADIIGVIED